jgi:hypothetical protein
MMKPLVGARRQSLPVAHSSPYNARPGRHLSTPSKRPVDPLYDFNQQIENAQPPTACDGTGRGLDTLVTMVSAAAVNAPAPAPVAEQQLPSCPPGDGVVFRAVHVWLSESPFCRLQSIVVHPVDLALKRKPRQIHCAEGSESSFESVDEEECEQGIGFVRPPPLPHSGNHHRRKRIGRKGKYANLLYHFAAENGPVRHSAVISSLQCAGFDETSDLKAPWSVRWAKRVEPSEYRLMSPGQKVNHFPGTWGIGRKDNLHKRLSSYLMRFGVKDFGFFPKGYLLPADTRRLEADMRERAALGTPKARNLYILKPVAAACAKGVKLINEPPSKPKQCIVQEYIQDPFLLRGFKFDLRVYVVVTSYEPLRLYVYEEGLVRIASTPYPAADAKPKMRDRTAHLTNYCVNRESDTFVSPDDAEAEGGDDAGSKWTFAQLRRHFEQELRRPEAWGVLWQHVVDVVAKTIISVEPDVVAQTRCNFPSEYTNCCFELYGFDILFRQDLTPVLMEVNIMPSLETRCSSLDQSVKGNMIADMLTLVGPVSLEKKQRRPRLSAEYAKLLDRIAPAPAQAAAVLHAAEEYARRTNFQRVLPDATNYAKYRRYFLEEREINLVLNEWTAVAPTVALGADQVAPAEDAEERE